MSLTSNNFKLGSIVTATFVSTSSSPTFQSNGIKVTDVGTNVDYTVINCIGTAGTGTYTPTVTLPSKQGNYVFVYNTAGNPITFQMYSGDVNSVSVSNTESTILYNVGTMYKKITLPNVTIDLSLLTPTTSVQSTAMFLIQQADGTQKSVTYSALLQQLGLSNTSSTLVTDLATLTNITLSGTGSVIDGTTVIAGNMIFALSQSVATQNGIYIASTGSWSRSPLFSEGLNASQFMVSVRSGSMNAGLYKNLQVYGSDVIGTNTLTWKKVVTGDTTTIQDTSGVLNVNHTLQLTGTLKVGSGASGSFANAPIQGISSVNSYAQIESQNLSTGTSASTDFIATADNGTDTTNYVDLGINGSGYSSAGWTVNGAGDSYLYASDGNLAVGVSGSAKKLALFAGGTTSSNIKAEVTTTGVNFTSGTTIVTGSLVATTAVQTGGALIFTGTLGFNQLGSGSYAADRVVLATEIGNGSPSPVCYPSFYRHQSTSSTLEGIDRVSSMIPLWGTQQVIVAGSSFKTAWFNLYFANSVFDVMTGDLHASFIPHNGASSMPVFLHTYFWSLYGLRQVILTPTTTNWATTLGAMTTTVPTATVTSSLGTSVTPTTNVYMSLTGSGGGANAELGITCGLYNTSASALTGSLFVWGIGVRHIITGSLS